MKHAQTRAREPSLPYATNVATWDTFDRWVDDQQRYRTGARSAQYLPAELRHYGGAFDHDGSWEYEQGYGYVWYPVVAVDWRPYYDGGWSFYGSFGWTWVGGGRWTWPTHHYGRWGCGHRTLVLDSGTPMGPAMGLVGQRARLSRMVPARIRQSAGHLGITNINVYGGDRRHGWTVLPSNRFGSRVAVSRQAVSPQTLILSDGSRFTHHASSPVRPSVAARQIEPLRAPTYSGGRYAVSAVGDDRRPRRRSARHGRPVSAGRDAVGVARGRVASTPGRPSNPVTRPSGPIEALRTSVNDATGPRSRSAAIGSADGDGGSVRPGSADVWTARQPPGVASKSEPGPRPAEGSTCGLEFRIVVRSGGRRRRSTSSAPAPLAFGAGDIGRRPSASPYESAPAPRVPSRVIGRGAASSLSATAGAPSRRASPRSVEHRCPNARRRIERRP